MKYFDQRTRDLELRLHHELNNAKNAHFISLEITPENISYLRLYLFVRSKEESLQNITTRALNLFIERFRKKYKTSFKRCLLATYSKTKNKIYIHGVIFTPNIEKLKSSWSFGSSENIIIEPIQGKTAFTTFFAKKYLDSYNQIIHLYTSTNFGSDSYQSETAKIIKLNKIDLLPGENFSPIPYQPGYFISTNGIVISKKRLKTNVLSTRTYNNHIYVTLFTNKKPKSYKIAFLMCQTFKKLTQHKGFYKIIHLNNRKSDNRLSNINLKLTA
jgi:hypothetical protein